MHKPPKILLLSTTTINIHWGDRTQIWYAHRDSPAKEFAIVKSGVHMHVRTCHMQDSSPKFPCYILTTPGPIVLLVGTYIETHQLRGLQLLKMGFVRTCSRVTGTNSQFPLLISGQLLADRADIGYTHRDSPVKGFALIKSWIDSHVRTCYVPNRLNIILLYLKNHWADGGQIWYAHRYSLARGFPMVNSGVHLHARTCHVQAPKSPCYISTTPWPIMLKFGTYIETHQLRGLQ